MSDRIAYVRRALECCTPRGLRSGIEELWQRPASQVPALDALRAIAVLLVIAAHWLGKDYVPSGGPPVHWPGIAENPALWLIWCLSYVGWTGVDLFFVLSGFLIGGMLWRELRRRGTIDFPRFFWRRAFRIWPLYFVMLSYYLVLHALGWSPIRPQWPDWLLVSNYVWGGFPRGWTLSTEEQFYIFVPLLLLALSPLFRDREARRVRLLRFFVVFAALELVVLCVRALQVRHALATGIDPAHADYTLVYPFHTHVEGLLAGLCISLLAVTRPRWFDRAGSTAPRWAGVAGLFAGAVLFVVLRLLDHSLFVFAGYGAFFGGCLWFALLDRSWVTRRLMAARAWYPFSRLSYGMYLNHWWALPIANGWGVMVMRTLSDRPAVIFIGSLVIGTMVSAAVAVISFLLVERPGLAARDVYVERHPEALTDAWTGRLVPAIEPRRPDGVPERQGIL